MIVVSSGAFQTVECARMRFVQVQRYSAILAQGSGAVLPPESHPNSRADLRGINLGGWSNGHSRISESFHNVAAVGVGSQAISQLPSCSGARMCVFFVGIRRCHAASQLPSCSVAHMCACFFGILSEPLCNVFYLFVPSLLFLSNLTRTQWLSDGHLAVCGWKITVWVEDDCVGGR